MNDSEQTAAIMTARVEACFREIRLALAPVRLTVNREGGFCNRRDVLDSIRVIKAKVIEAEALLRTAYRRAEDGRKIRLERERGELQNNFGKTRDRLAEVDAELRALDSVTS